MSKRFKGKVAIVVGAGTGMGEAIAHKLAREGAEVCVFGLPRDPIDEVVADINKQYSDVAIDRGRVQAGTIERDRRRLGRHAGRGGVRSDRRNARAARQA